MTSPYTAALAALDALYAQLPRLECQQKCQGTCGVIIFSRLEWQRILNTTRQKAQGKRDCVCPYLKKGGCSIHKHRPAICRLYGLTEEMRCPWGCVPEYWLSDEEYHAFLNVIEMISQTLFPGKSPAAWLYGLAPEEVMPYIAQAKRDGVVDYTKRGNVRSEENDDENRRRLAR